LVFPQPRGNGNSLFSAQKIALCRMYQLKGKKDKPLSIQERTRAEKREKLQSHYIYPQQKQFKELLPLFVPTCGN